MKISTLARLAIYTPIRGILVVGGAICMIKGIYELYKSAKEEGAEEELLGADPDEPTPKTPKSIFKAAVKKVKHIFVRHEKAISWFGTSFDCLLTAMRLEVEVKKTFMNAALEKQRALVRERKLKDDLIDGICKFSHKLTEERNSAFHISDGMDHSKMGFKFVRQKVRTLDSVCDWMDEFLGKSLAAVNVTRG